jgi:hypothetical protein
MTAPPSPRHEPDGENLDVAGPEIEWPIVVRPVKSARIAIVLAVLIIILFVVIAAFLPDEKAGVSFTGADQWGMAGVGLLIASGILRFTAPRVRAGRAGVETRSFFGSSRLVEWPLIVSVEFLPRTRFARLVLPGDEMVTLYAIQRGDAEQSVEAMRQLRLEQIRWSA